MYQWRGMEDGGWLLRTPGEFGVGLARNGLWPGAKPFAAKSLFYWGICYIY